MPKFSHQIGTIVICLIAVVVLLATRPNQTIAQPAAPTPGRTATPPPMSCTDILTSAENNLASKCQALTADQGCYGRSPATSDFQQPTNLHFASVGDVVPVSALKSIRLAPFDAVNKNWGLVTFRALALNPDNAINGQPVTFIGYGDVSISNITGDAQPLPTPTPSPQVCRATVKRPTRLHTAPSLNAEVSALMVPGQVVKISQRTVDNGWLYGQISAPPPSKMGWTFTGNLDLTCQMRDLPVADPRVPLIMPAVRSFTFVTGVSAQAVCNDLPPGGLFIHVPGGQKTRFIANGVDITAGATMILRAQPNKLMLVDVLDGEIIERIGDHTLVADAGEESRIQLGGVDGLQAQSFYGDPYLISQDAATNQVFTAQVCGLADALGGMDIPLCDKYLSPTRPCTRVTTLYDRGPGSLRNAIDCAAPGDTIDFDSSLHGTIVLTSGQLEISKDLKIAGPANPNTIVVSGGDISRMFYIEKGTLEIARITIQDGNAAYGGGVVNFGNLLLTNDMFFDNSANSAGAIYNGSTLKIVSSTFFDNTANSTTGGAIENTGTLTINDSVFSGNSAAGSGGAIDLGGSGEVHITGSLFSNNNAPTGGAIRTNLQASLTVAHSAFLGNGATGPFGGGAIHGFSEGATALTNNCFVGNTGAPGTAINNAFGPQITSTNNWWGSPTGPMPGDVNGGVVTIPFSAIPIADAPGC